jgi:hypothetical protein
MQMKFNHTLAGATAAGILAMTGIAQAAVFDFESIAVGTYTSASQTVDGLTATFTSATGQFDVQNIGSGIPGMSNNVLINYFYGVGPFTADFSTAVSNVSITGGDYGADVDHITLAAYSGLDGTGVLLGAITGPDCCAGSPGSETVSLNVSGVRSVQFYTSLSDPFPGSVYFDNLTANGGVPEPATWAMILIGFGGVAAVMRSARRRDRAAIAVS